MSKIDDLQAELEALMGNRPQISQDPKYHRFQCYEHQVTTKRGRPLELARWCNTHCRDNYSMDVVNTKGDHFSFVDPQDAMLFKLTWGGV